MRWISVEFEFGKKKNALRQTKFVGGNKFSGPKQTWSTTKVLKDFGTQNKIRYSHTNIEVLGNKYI